MTTELNDLTIIFLTINKVPEKWAAYHRKVTEDAIRGTPIISISAKPMDWGTNLIQEPGGFINIYRQLLRGAKEATTKYIAVVEDDTLYPREHFTSFRPPDDAFAYNMNRWGVFTWGPPTYFWKNRVTNASLIAPRELAVTALEERFEKMPEDFPDDKIGELGRSVIETRLNVTRRKLVKFNTINPVVCFNHDYSLDRLEKSHKKRMSKIRAFDIPHWGRAEELVKEFS